MKRIYIALLLFLFLILEGVATRFLPTEFFDGDLLIIPHWILSGIILVTLLYFRVNSFNAVLLALIFGLLKDIVYTEILGVYMFSYAATVYIVFVLKKLLHVNFFVLLLFGIIGIGLSDLFVYFIYYVIGIVATDWIDYLNYRLLPTIGLNLVFLIIIYLLFSKVLIRWGREADWE